MAHASSRANSVAPSLFYHGSEVQHAGGYTGKMSEREKEKEERRAALLSPDPHVAAVSPLNCRSINIPRLNPLSVPTSLAFYFVLSLRLCP